MTHGYQPAGTIVDPAIRAFALSERQLAYVDAAIEHGSIAAGAKALGIARQVLSKALKAVTLRYEQAKRQEQFAGRTTEGFTVREVTTARDADGEVTGEWMREGPEPQSHGGVGEGPERDGHGGWHVRGVSTLYGPDGGVRSQWVKTSADAKNEALAAERVAKWIAERDITGRSPLVAAPAHNDNDLLAIYPMGDPHFGLYAWAAESGADFDLTIAKELTCKAIDRLVSAAPPARLALLLNLGDFFHADNAKNQTPGSGHALDVDTREGKVIDCGLEAMFHCVERLLERHAEVIVWNNEGNHDPTSSKWLAQVLKAYFRNNERVTVDTSPGFFKYLRFGKVLIGSHHGHGPKMEQLALIMAADRAEDWGATTARHWYVGHVHHKNLLGKEQPGVMIESFNTLAAADAWHAGQGYRARRDMVCIVHHQDHGEVARLRFDVSMWKPAA